MDYKEIINSLPYTKPFLFVDELVSVTENRLEGSYTFKEDEYFYKGHFKDNPVTPGVILVECMAQIGVVCLGIFLAKDVLKDDASKKWKIALSSHHIDFYTFVYPKEKITVLSEKEYFRFNKLKCKVKILNEAGALVAKGTMSGMVFQ